MPAPAPLSPESLGGRITLHSDFMAIRHGLAQLLAMSPLRELSDAGRGTAEIVLAEALNNIVEHAYADCSGDVCVDVTRCDGDILCQIRDHGRPMPGGTPPNGDLLPFDSGDLPEGGFGWFLIRTLARDLSYHRDGAENVLIFRLDAV